jgi:uncharacterized membrane protein YhaH (DUF805 family)
MPKHNACDLAIVDGQNSIQGGVMNFGQAIKSGFSHYVTFSGRATRPEYWYWVLFAVIGGAVTVMLDAAIFGLGNGVTPLNGIFSLATFLPGLALASRRLHDIDRMAWWLLLALTGIGAILLIVWFCFKGTPGPNRFGDKPLQ